MPEAATCAENSMIAPSQNAKRHGLAARGPRSDHGNDRITALALGFLGNLPRSGLAWDLALTAGTAQYQLERIALMKVALFQDAEASRQAERGRVLWRQIERDLKALERLAMIDRSGKTFDVPLEDLTAAPFPDDDTHMAHRQVALRHVFRQLERYCSRAISRRSKAVEKLTALIAGAGSDLMQSKDENGTQLMT